jgi:hypothetical protein
MTVLDPSASRLRKTLTVLGLASSTWLLCWRSPSSSSAPGRSRRSRGCLLSKLITIWFGRAGRQRTTAGTVGRVRRVLRAGVRSSRRSCRCRSSASRTRWWGNWACPVRWLGGAAAHGHGLRRPVLRPARRGEVGDGQVGARLRPTVSPR